MTKKNVFILKWQTLFYKVEKYSMIKGLRYHRSATLIMRTVITWIAVDEIAMISCHGARIYIAHQGDEEKLK